MPQEPKEHVKNVNIASLCDFVTSCTEELLGLQSKANSKLLEQEYERQKSYWKTLKAYVDLFSERPSLDMPKTHPRQYALREFPDMPEDMGNMSIRDVYRFYQAFHIEASHSQSAGNASGIWKTATTNDHLRLTSICDEALLTLERHSKNDLDFPVNSPGHDAN